LDWFLETKKATRGHWVAFWFAAISGGVGIRLPLRGKVRIKSGTDERTLLVRRKRANSITA